MDRQEQRRLINKALVVAVVLLLILTGVLLWLLTRPQPEPTKIPTGNVDVFDIDISCLCVGENGEECDDDDEDDENEVTPGPDGYKNYQGSTINNHDGNSTTEDDDGIVYVDDLNGNYVYQKNLKIFENAAFEYTNKIAPGVSNSYDFKIHNETKNTIRYNIIFTENSEYAVNMLYRLKREGSYVVGSDNEWVSADELILSAKKHLMKNDTDSYTLDWKWPYEGGTDAADTEAGEKMTSDYKLGIKITFEEV